MLQRENPIPPLLPLRIARARLEALVLDSAEVGHLVPRLAGAGAVAAAAATAAQQPARNAARRAVPAGLAHQALDRLLLAPALLGRDVWEVCGAVAPSAVDEGDAQPVRAQGPVQGVGAGFEGAQESQGA